jgi:uncharacterized protein (DUF1330 family)
MNVENAVAPNREQIAQLGEQGEDQPICMVNLLKFKAKAEYADGRVTELTGREAYGLYGVEVVEHLKKVGAEIVFSSVVTGLFLGEVEDLWDSVAIAKYPSRKAMLTMLMDPDYRKSEEHRSAGLAGQLNIETVAGAA